MLKAIGGAVVYGFALYGLNKFIDQMRGLKRGIKQVGPAATKGGEAESGGATAR